MSHDLCAQRGQCGGIDKSKGLLLAGILKTSV